MDGHTYEQESLGLLSARTDVGNSPRHKMLSQGNQSPFRQRRKVKRSGWRGSGFLVKGIFIQNYLGSAPWLIKYLDDQPLSSWFPQNKYSWV